MTGRTYDKDVKVDNSFQDKAVPLDKSFVDYIEELVEGVEIDIDAPLKEEADAMMKILFIVVLVTLAGCSGGHVTYPRHIEYAKKVCLNNEGWRKIEYETSTEGVTRDLQVHCKNGAKFETSDFTLISEEHREKGI